MILRNTFYEKYKFYSDFQNPMLTNRSALYKIRPNMQKTTLLSLGIFAMMMSMMMPRLRAWVVASRRRRH